MKRYRARILVAIAAIGVLVGCGLIVLPTPVTSSCRHGRHPAEQG